MEQVLGYPEASPAPPASYAGLVEWLSFPAGLLIMAGLFTRKVSLALAGMYIALAFVGPFQRGLLTHRNGADPIVLSAFFFLYLAAAGGGAWSLDRRRNPTAERAADVAWEPHALALLRVVAGLLFVMHGLEKLFAIGGAGRITRSILTVRGFAGYLETTGGPLIALGFLTRPLAFILAGQMAVAYFTSWAPRGFWESFAEAGMEASVLFCYLYLFLSSRGAGPYSLDGARRAWRAVDRRRVPLPADG